MAATMKHASEKHHGEWLTVVLLEGNQYLIGVEVAGLLQRETYNVYRSLKMKQVPLRRALPDQIDYLTRAKIVAVGTHSVTFVPYAEGLNFISRESYYASRLF